MSDDDNKRDLPSLFGEDPAGGRELGKTVRESVREVFSWLRAICQPAAVEVGQLLADQVRGWRAENAVKTLMRARELQTQLGIDPANVHAPPRLTYRVCEEASWEDRDEIQAMWAGLLVSSCTEDGTDDGNLIFVNYLKEINSSQARLLDYAAANCPKQCGLHGLVMPEPYTSTLEELIRITGIDDLHRLDRELDHLASMGLLGLEGVTAAGILFDRRMLVMQVNITPSPLALHLYVRAQGSRQPVAEFFKLTPPEPPAPAPPAPAEAPRVNLPSAG